MIPHYFVRLEKIPVTPSGKVDRKALPVPVLAPADEYTAPRTRIEKELVEIWSGILGLEKDLIGLDNNFFQLGGHSLKAAVLITKIHKELNIKMPLAEVFQDPTIRGLAKFIKGAVENQYASIEPVEKKEYYPLSSAQKRLYILQQMSCDNTVYNLPNIFSWAGEPDIVKLHEVFRKLIRRHESLRTSFHMIDKEPVQVIHDEVEFEIEWGESAAALISSFIRPFDLSRAPLIRSGFIKLPGGNHAWIIDIHHIVSDGTSQTILTEDFISLYQGYQLEPLRLRYKDFSQWQNHLVGTGERKKQEEYWLTLFSRSGAVPRLDLPTDYQRPTIFTFKGESG